MGFQNATSPQLKLGSSQQLLRQTYGSLELPNQVQLVKISLFYDDAGGWFKENLRLNEQGHVIVLKEKGTEFTIRQSNTSYIAPACKRFWHIHPDQPQRPGQNEVWTVNSTLLVGLVDLRKSSPTYGLKSKVILSPDKLLYIPSGVAHGFINPNPHPVILTYFTDQFFSADDSTQEYRIDPSTLPFDFVEPETL